MIHHPTCRGECWYIAKDNEQSPATMACFFFNQGVTEGILIGEQRERAKIVALLRTAVRDDWFEHVGPDSLVSGLIALIENHAGGREGGGNG